MNNIVYIISHYDREDDYNEKCISKSESLLNLIKQYKMERKEWRIGIRIYEIDGDLIYSRCYDYDEDATIIFDDCVNMKDEYWK